MVLNERLDRIKINKFEVNELDIQFIRNIDYFHKFIILNLISCFETRSTDMIQYVAFNSTVQQIILSIVTKNNKEKKRNILEDNIGIFDFLYFGILLLYNLFNRPIGLI